MRVTTLTRLGVCAAITVTIALILASGAEATLLGIGRGGENSLEVHTIDPATGTATRVAAVHHSVFGAATGGNFGLDYFNGTLYASDIQFESPLTGITSYFGSIDLATGVFTILNPQEVDGRFPWPGLASNRNAGVLYTVASSPADGFVLKSITPGGVATTIAPIVGDTQGTLPGLAYDNVHHILYAVDQPNVILNAIDVVTGAVTRIGVTGLGTKSTKVGLAYDEESDVLYLSYIGDRPDLMPDGLYALDRATGTPTFITTIQSPVVFDGLAWAPTAVAEPSVIAISLFALAGTLAARRRRILR